MYEVALVEYKTMYASAFHTLYVHFINAASKAFESQEFINTFAIKESHP